MYGPKNGRQAFAEKHALAAGMTSLAKTTLALLGIALCKVSLTSIGFRFQGPGSRVQGAGSRAQGSWFRAQGSGFREVAPLSISL